jgi:predicted transcriptional regulator
MNGLQESIQIRISPETKRQLEQIAKDRHLKLSTLIRAWIIERLQSERLQSELENDKLLD